MTDRRPELGTVIDKVEWPGLVAARLEELVWGLLADMGARDMIWRAGSASGVTAADGGRDIEATFRTPKSAGGFSDERWWVEVKGRAKTVGRRIVQDAAFAAAARAEVDRIVVATNSVFVNSAHDWVRDWNIKGVGPTIELWDRENLAVMVRKAPHVAARVLPDALSDEDHLLLLLERFHSYGETPTERDAAYFWERGTVIQSSHRSVASIAMFLYADEMRKLEERPWGSLLGDSEDELFDALMHVFFLVPQSVLPDRVRPLNSERQIEVAAYLLVAIAAEIDPSAAAHVAQNPFKYLEGWDDAAATEEVGAGWRDGIVHPVLGRVQTELASICATDCARVNTETGAFAESMTAQRYFRRFDAPSAVEGPNGFLTIVDRRVPCLAGCSLSETGDCIVTRDLDSSYGATESFFSDLASVLAFRREHPDGQYFRGREIAPL